MKENLEYVDKYEERFLSCIRILTNCLITDDCLLLFDDKEYKPVLTKIISMLEFFHVDFKERFSFVPQDKID